jgi:hypothetical protein
MQTRQSPRRNIKVPGRYFTGVGDPIDVMIGDISEGGCRFVIDPRLVSLGSQLQVTIGGSGPHRAVVRWLEKGVAGVTFQRKLNPELIEQFQSSHIPDTADFPAPADFELFDYAPPQRFC